MKKIAIILLLLLLPLCSATLTDDPNSVSCQINEVQVSPDLGSASVLREDITSIELDKYWNIWCYAQDAQNKAVSNAQVSIKIDGTEISNGNTVGGWINFPIIYSPTSQAAYYSTTTPGQGVHQISASAGTAKEYNQTLTVGGNGAIDVRLLYLGIIVVLLAIGFLVYHLIGGKKR